MKSLTSTVESYNRAFCEAREGEGQLLSPLYETSKSSLITLVSVGARAYSLPSACRSCLGVLLRVSLASSATASVSTDESSFTHMLASASASARQTPLAQSLT